LIFEFGKKVCDAVHLRAVMAFHGPAFVTAMAHPTKRAVSRDRAGAICERDSPFDCVLMSPQNRGKTLADLPPGSVIGTSSLRRSAQVLFTHVHFVFAKTVN
jgi:hypothetical protein